jgi:hypothetical protein
MGCAMPSFMTVSISATPPTPWNKRLDGLVDHRHQDAVGHEARE